MKAHILTDLEILTELFNQKIGLILSEECNIEYLQVTLLGINTSSHQVIEQIENDIKEKKNHIEELKKISRIIKARMDKIK